MPVLSKKKHSSIMRELERRIDNLRTLLTPNELKYANEGCKNKQHWAYPDNMCKTTGRDYEIRLATEDFKNILSEIKKLK